MSKIKVSQLQHPSATDPAIELDASGNAEYAGTHDFSNATVLEPAGRVLQVVYGSTNTSAQNNTSTFADTNLTATITPSSASSKVLVLVNQVELSKDTNNVGIGLQLVRGASSILVFAQNAGFTNSSARNDVGGVGCVYLDSPNTTSATTYKTQFKSEGNNSATYVQRGGVAYSTIVLVEISG